MTWKELCELEPSLKELYSEARAVKATDECFCANRLWYSRFKPRLVKLAGWGARDIKLRSSGAYDTAYEKIYRALPDCLN